MIDSELVDMWSQTKRTRDQCQWFTDLITNRLFEIIFDFSLSLCQRTIRYLLGLGAVSNGQPVWKLPCLSQLSML